MRGLIKILTGKRARIAAVAVCVLIAVTAIRAMDPGLLAGVRELTFDTFQRIRPRAYQEAPVRIVDIDEASIAEFGQWPWPRTRIAELTRTLTDLGAAVIAFDIIFSEPDRTSPANLKTLLGIPPTDTLATALDALPDHDAVFADVIGQSPVVLGFALLPSTDRNTPAKKAGFAFGGPDPAQFLPTFSDALTGLPILEEHASGSGGISLNIRDSGGIVRRAPLLFSDGTGLYPSLAAEALRVAQGASGYIVRSTGASGEVAGDIPALTDLKIGAFTVPTTATGELWVHFDIDRPERYVSVRDVLDPGKRTEIAPLIEGQIVFVGTSAAGLLDIRATPLGEAVPGVSIHAQAIEQILAGDFLERPDWADGAEVLVTFLVGLMMIAALPVAGSVATAVLGCAAAIFLVGGSAYLFFEHGILLDPVYPSLASFFVFAVATILLYILTEREKRFVRQAFGQYLSPHLVSQLENAPEQLVLGGEIRPMTILFMDIRGFTPISEQLTPTELVSFLNTLLSPLSDAIQTEEGTIDKYIGDSIMAFWNAPLTIKNHAAHACRASLDMLAMVDRLNADDAFGFKARGLKTQTVQIGIGLNTGDACVGNMGSDKRFNYSVIGDAVNIASRIESSCKGVGAELLVSDATRDAAPAFAYLEAGRIALKGKSKPVTLYALVGDEGHAASEEFARLRAEHDLMIQAIASEQYDAALDRLDICRSHCPRTLAPFYQCFEEKIRALIANAPDRQLAQEGAAQ